MSALPDRRSVPPARALPTLLLAGTLAISACAPRGGGAPEPPPAPPAATAEQGAWPEADPRDVESVDAIVAALYDVISGPAGEERDWDRLRSLFLPSGRLTATGMRPGGPVHFAWSVEDYIRVAGASLERDGFFEEEIGRTEERFGNVADLMSAYSSRRTEDGEVFARGVNSIQLLHDGERWWVVSILWDSEREGNPIPERYLGG